MRGELCWLAGEWERHIWPVKDWGVFVWVTKAKSMGGVCPASSLGESQCIAESWTCQEPETGGWWWWGQAHDWTSLWATFLGMAGQEAKRSFHLTQAQKDALLYVGSCSSIYFKIIITANNFPPEWSQYEWHCNEFMGFDLDRCVSITLEDNSDRASVPWPSFPLRSPFLFWDFCSL